MALVAAQTLLLYTPLPLTATPSTLNTWRSPSCRPSSLSVPPFDSFFLVYLCTTKKTHTCKVGSYVSDPNRLLYDGEPFACIISDGWPTVLLHYHAYFTFYFDSSRLNSLKSQTLVPLSICPLIYIVCSVSRIYQVVPVQGALITMFAWVRN